MLVIRYFLPIAAATHNKIKQNKIKQNFIYSKHHTQKILICIRIFLLFFFFTKSCVKEYFYLLSININNQYIFSSFLYFQVLHASEGTVEMHNFQPQLFLKKNLKLGFFLIIYLHHISKSIFTVTIFYFQSSNFYIFRVNAIFFQCFYCSVKPTIQKILFLHKYKSNCHIWLQLQTQLQTSNTTHTKCVSALQQKRSVFFSCFSN
eukprot:TRINITY_DN5398_c0_g2_i1.p1 TRINITY_DN5398_c0_g2~~TRINITY_DN5398_c0_g2_i1.p1  ORF type:complete len:205 (-),score=-13.79 TRINITY_DN5398_c0_g2_i1:697-1311(-)